MARFKQKALSAWLLATSLIVSNQALAGNSERYGLYDAKDFRVTTGECKDCQTIAQALWYFEKETIATPLDLATGFDRRLAPQADIKRWLKSGAAGLSDAPSLIWTGETDYAEGLISNSGSALSTAESEMPLKMVTRLESNRSFYNEASIQFFTNKKLAVFGKQASDGFTAHTLWPLDFNLTPANTKSLPLNSTQSIADLVRQNNGGAQSPFQARVLWQKSNNVAWQNKPVMAFILNGAQGDDDEAHGGHFAVATGKFGQNGEWHDWLVNNFYNLASVSEKGIIAASVPMSRYQGELNSGQSWYRPSYMLVAVLKDEHNATLYQSAINRVFNHFYRQDFLYRHAGVNCAGINLETMRSIGWQIPKRGATSLAKAFIALPYKAISDRSLEKGLMAFDYLSAEQTNLYPFVAFEAISDDLLQRIAQGKVETEFEKKLADDLEAIIYVHIPQFPSSRALGQAPVASLDEYMARVPEDLTKWKVIPVGNRQFPEHLKDPQSAGDSVRPAMMGVMGWGLLLGFTLNAWVRKRKNKMGAL